MPDEKSLPWDPETTPAWRTTVNGWKWQRMGPDGWSKDGLCPRCKHGMSVIKDEGNITELVMSEASRVALATGAASEHDDQDGCFAYCNCGEQHPGRPADITGGCGSRAYIDPPPERAGQ